MFLVGFLLPCKLRMLLSLFFTRESHYHLSMYFAATNIFFFFFLTSLLQYNCFTMCYPFICRWALRLLPCPGYCKYSAAPNFTNIVCPLLSHTPILTFIDQCLFNSFIFILAGFKDSIKINLYSNNHIYITSVIVKYLPINKN